MYYYWCCYYKSDFLYSGLKKETLNLGHRLWSSKSLNHKSKNNATEKYNLRQVRNNT